MLWNTNPYLDVLEQEIHDKDNWLNKVEEDFLEISILQKRRNVSWRWRIAIAVMLGLVGLTITTLIQKRNSELNLADSLVQTTLQLWNDGYKNLDTSLLALEAGKLIQKHNVHDLAIYLLAGLRQKHRFKKG